MSSDRLPLSSDKCDGQRRGGVPNCSLSSVRLNPPLLSPSVTFVMSHGQMSHAVTCPQFAVGSQWYQKPTVQGALFSQCGPMREVAVAVDGRFVRNLVARTDDDLSRILRAATSVYGSIEKFYNPTKGEGRFGWDFAIDLDGDDWSEVVWVTQLFRDIILPEFKIKHYKLKFSGRRGVHIIIPESAFLFYFKPLEAFPLAYPRVPAAIARFFDAMIYPESKKHCKIDMQLYSVRKLLRCAYSLHDETGLVSTPIWPEDLEKFEPGQCARPENIHVDPEWLKLEPTPGEASFLLEKVSEWLQNTPTQKPTIVHHRRRPSNMTAYGIMPCIKKFMDRGFTASMKGNRNQILFNVIQAIKRFTLPISDDQLLEANRRSESPLPERELKAMLSYHRSRQSTYYFKPEVLRDVGLCPSEGCWLCHRRML